MQHNIATLRASVDIFIQNKEHILKQWLSYEGPKKILTLHEIDSDFFKEKFATGVFDYFMGVIAGNVEIGNCPVMKELLAYLKKREISADELFEICSHFRRSMVDFSYDIKLNSKDFFDEISYIFDENFKGILKYYTDTIFQKLIDARQEALDASQAKERFLSNMSHEIRTPLNAILGFIEILLHEEVSTEHRNYLNIIKNSGENLLVLINDILDFSKLKSGEFQIENKSFSLHEELSYTLELFAASAHLKGITLISFIDPGIPSKLYGDAVRVNQIVSNLLSNAIKFTQNYGYIKLEVLYVNNYLNICVEDNGIGIHEKDLEKIFSAFTQGDYERDITLEGTGLGLSICHQLVKKMNGNISVSSKVAKGSTFNVSLQIQSSEDTCKKFDEFYLMRNIHLALYNQGKALSEKQQSFLRYATVLKMNIFITDNLESNFDVMLFVDEDIDETFKKRVLKHDKKFIALSNTVDEDFDSLEYVEILSFPLYCHKMQECFSRLLGNKITSQIPETKIQQYYGHVLLAEDNEANQELIKIILSKYGLTYDLVFNGLEAFEFYKKNSYDLLLIDEQMPLMRGHEVVIKIREYENQFSMQRTPISALTANVMKGAREQGLLAGFDAFLEKPLSLERLEGVFSLYLKKKMQHLNITGINERKLLKELMLTQEELRLLLGLFLEKMKITLVELSEMIEQKHYENIALLSHSIKGSSSNFRLKNIQKISLEMEGMAEEKNQVYDYMKSFFSLKEEIENIRLF